METELKLLLEPADLRRLRRDPRIKALQQGRAATRRVRSVYYDTPERDLLRAGLALRLRSDGGRWLQTLKTEGRAAAGLHVREEWEWPLPGEALDFGLLAAIPEAKLLRAPGLRATLRPVFATEFERTRLKLAFSDGSQAELCLDSGRVGSGRRSVAISEAEIELVSGSRARLFELALELLDRVPLRLGAQSKAERGYALARTTPAQAVKAAPLILNPQGDVATAFTTIVYGCMAHLQANEAGFLAGRDPEYLHQVRVAVRRLRACISLFGNAIAHDVFTSVMQQLRQQGAALGRARDWDVFVHEMLCALRRQRSDETAVIAFERRCVSLGRVRTREARAVVASAAWQRLWLTLGRSLADAGWQQGRAVLAAPVDVFAASVLQQRATALSKRGKHLQALDAAERHRLRIAAKKLRYAAEFFAALFPKRQVRSYVQALAGLQQVLGGLNDAATLLRLLPEAVAGARLPDARVSGMIEGWSAAATHLQLDTLAAAWEHWQRQKPFWKSPNA
jgi:inorganic triphosphatase YgiF